MAETKRGSEQRRIAHVLMRHVVRASEAHAKKEALQVFLTYLEGAGRELLESPKLRAALLSMTYNWATKMPAMQHWREANYTRDELKTFAAEASKYHHPDCPVPAAETKAAQPKEPLTTEACGNYLWRNFEKKHPDELDLLENDLRRVLVCYR